MSIIDQIANKETESAAPGVELVHSSLVQTAELDCRSRGDETLTKPVARQTGQNSQIIQSLLTVAAPLAKSPTEKEVSVAAPRERALAEDECHSPVLREESQSLVTSAATDKRIETLETAMLKMPQADCPVTSLFAPGIYWREIEIPAGAVALGHKHKTEHLNVLLSGRVRVLCDGHVKELVAPQVFSSPAGVRKLVYAVEPSRWANVHANPTDETDMAKLELIFIEKSAAFLAHQEEIAQLVNQNDQSRDREGAESANGTRDPGKIRSLTVAAQSQKSRTSEQAVVSNQNERSE